jgi:hypothetical protein
MFWHCFSCCEFDFYTPFVCLGCCFPVVIFGWLLEPNLWLCQYTWYIGKMCVQYTLCILPGLIVAAELGDSFYIPMRVSLGPTVTSLLRNLCSCVLHTIYGFFRCHSSA